MVRCGARTAVVAAFAAVLLIVHVNDVAAEDSLLDDGLHAAGAPESVNSYDGTNDGNAGVIMDSTDEPSGHLTEGRRHFVVEAGDDSRVVERIEEDASVVPATQENSDSSVFDRALGADTSAGAGDNANDHPIVEAVAINIGEPLNDGDGEASQARGTASTTSNVEILDGEVAAVDPQVASVAAEKAASAAPETLRESGPPASDAATDPASHHDAALHRDGGAEAEGGAEGSHQSDGDVATTERRVEGSDEAASAVPDAVAVAGSDDGRDTPSAAPTTPLDHGDGGGGAVPASVSEVERATASDPLVEHATAAAPVPVPAPSDVMLCRLCGASITHVSGHLAGVQINSPHVIGTKHEPELGPQGTLLQWTSGPDRAPPRTAAGSESRAPAHVATRSGALFASKPDVHAAVKVAEAAEKSELVRGYRHHAASCARCGAALGWRFTASQHAGVPLPLGTAQAGVPSPPVEAVERVPGSDFSVVPYDGDNEDTVLSHLDGTCLTLARGWWSFEWCHKQRIRQFHVNPDHTVGPDWSLGEYVKIHAERVVSPSPRYYTSHYFRGGQHCDETNKGRATEVQFHCCVDDNTAAPLSIRNVEEPDTCKYRMTICVPMLCRASTPPSDEPQVTPLVGDGAPIPTPDEPQVTLLAGDGGGAEYAVRHGAASEDVVPSRDTHVAAVEAATHSSNIDSGLPVEFFAFSWASLVGDRSDEFTSAAEGRFTTSVAQLRFV